MQLKKIFFPIGGGEELAERIHGALLVNKFFGTHINIMACQLDPKMIYNVRMTLKGGVLMEEFLKSAGDEMQAEREEIRAIFDAECAIAIWYWSRCRLRALSRARSRRRSLKAASLASSYRASCRSLRRIKF